MNKKYYMEQLETAQSAKTWHALGDLDHWTLDICPDKPCPFAMERRSFFQKLWNVKTSEVVPDFRGHQGCLLATLPNFTDADFMAFLDCSGWLSCFGFNHIELPYDEKGYNLEAYFSFYDVNGERIKFSLYDRFGQWRVGGSDERIVLIMKALGFMSNPNTGHDHQKMIQQVAIACEGGF